MSKFYHKKGRRLILMPDGLRESTSNGLVKLDDISKNSLAEIRRRMKQDILDGMNMYKKIVSINNP